MTTFRQSLLSLLLVLLTTAPSFAQRPPDRTVRGAATALLGSGFSPTEIEAVASMLALQISTFPIGTSSGGFTYKIDSSTRALVLNSPSFGPLFAERASTLGEQGTLAVNVSAQSTRFESFEGRGLRDGELASRTVVNGQLVDINRFTFNVATQTTAIAATYAADTSIDVGVIIPIVRTSLTGTSSSFVSATLPPVQRIVDSSGSGLGDIVIRGKWNFYPGLAALGEVFLPTGSVERLTSTGRVRVRPQFVASATVGSFSPHANVGYTFGGSGVEVADDGVFVPEIRRADPGDEFNYTIGADVAPTGSLTVFADLIGRSYRSVVRFDGGIRLADIPGVGPIPVETFVAREGTLNTRLAAVGAKTIVLGKGLVSAALLVQLSDEGVKAGLTPVIGFEYTF